MVGSVLVSGEWLHIEPHGPFLPLPPLSMLPDMQPGGPVVGCTQGGRVGPVHSQSGTSIWWSRASI